MEFLSIAAATNAVRKNIDEVGLNLSDMIGNDVDAQELNAIISGSLCEAVDIIHGRAVLYRLEGESVELTLESEGDFEMSYDEGSQDVLRIKSSKNDFLRLISFKVSDSPYVVTDWSSESSAVGRMQYNPYTRGTWDNPRLVLMSGRLSSPEFKYFSTNGKSEDIKARLEYIPIASIGIYSTSSEAGVKIARGMKDAVINELTAIVLQSYKEIEYSKVFQQKAIDAIQ